jgi:acetyl-CoA carboxylase biotin carboxyl carrier protein|tara:strand:+ start:139 stop:417 length:279 start_codon:yes stop_codon:yes gene_type:complete
LRSPLEVVGAAIADKGKAEMVDVKSEVAGRVWQIVAGEGETVAADDPIVILESMKMEIPVLSPVAGTVTRLAVGEEDMLDEEQLVAEVTPAG